MSDELNKFIATFVQREKQDRYQSLLSNKKRRNDALWDLLHDGRHLDKSKFTLIPSHQLGSVIDRLKKFEVKGLGYVMAAQGEFDDQLVELTAVLERYLGKSMDVAAFFPVGNAGYYENHEGEVYVFSAKL